MFHKVLAALFALLAAFLAATSLAQTAAVSARVSLPAAPGFRKLAAEDLKKGKELNDRFVSAAGAELWDDAIGAAEELLALSMRVYGARHFEVVTNVWRIQDVRRRMAMSKDDQAAFRSNSEMIGKALSLERQGKYSEAQPLWEKALAIHRRLMSDDHPKTARFYGALAYNLWNQGQLGAAQTFCEKAVEMQRRLLGDDHPDTAASYVDLANNLMAQGKHEAAQLLFEKALGICRRLLGDEHTMTATVYNNLANNLRDQGRYSEAQPLFESALEIKRRLLGDSHPDLASIYNNLAANFYSQRMYAEAQPLYEKAIAIGRTRLGDRHPEMAASYNNLAMNFQARGKYVAAEPLFKKALAINWQLLGDGHPRTTNTCNNLCRTSSRRGSLLKHATSGHTRPGVLSWVDCRRGTPVWTARPPRPRQSLFFTWPRFWLAWGNTARHGSGWRALSDAVSWMTSPRATTLACQKKSVPVLLKHSESSKSLIGSLRRRPRR